MKLTTTSFHLILTASFLALLIALPNTLAQGADPSLGTWKTEGKVTTTATEVFSKDGKTFTRKQESTNGSKLTYVYDRQ